MGIENFTSFAFTALLFIMTPGMDTVFVLNKTISQGKTSGAYAALGVNAGVIVHTLLAALGLSILVAQSPQAFTVIKYLGAVFIIYLGVIQWIKKSDTTPINGKVANKTTRRNNFTSGFMTNALNPKVALFFLAFFPQFINSTQLQNPVPFMLLGLTYTVIGIVWYLCLTYFAGTFTQEIKNNPHTHSWINRSSGVVFILMGIGIVLGG